MNDSLNASDNDPSFAVYQPAVSVLSGPSLLELELNSRLQADSLSLCLAPKFSTAVISHPYGFMSFPSENVFAAEAPLSLQGSYAQIQIDGKPVFTGVVVDPSDYPGGTHNEISSGLNRYSLASLDFLLDRIYIDATHTLSRGTLALPVAFNGSGGGRETGGGRERNRSAGKVDSSYVFDWSEDARNWTALDIVEYLLARFSSLSGFEWKLSGLYEYLSSIVVQLDPCGLTLRQCLQQLIKPEWGFSWFVDVELSGSVPNLYIRVVSVSDAPISSDDSTIIVPASDLISEVSSLTANYARHVSSVSICSLSQSAYSSIRVFSEPIRINASFALGDETLGLASDWLPTLALAYNFADDRQRQQDKYSSVFSRFKLGPSWAGADMHGSPIVPDFDESSCEYSFASAAPRFAWEAHAFERTLPVLLSENPDNWKTKRPLLLLETEKPDGSTCYVVSERNAYVENASAKTNIGFRLLDDRPGILIDPPIPHLLAKGRFSAKSDYVPLFAYEKAVFTGSLYTDTPLAITLEGVSEEAIDRKKSIYVPGLHLWLTAPDTWIDADTRTPSSWTVERDDRATLKAIASAVKAWYGRKRSSVSVTYNILMPFTYLGYIVTGVYDGGSFVPAGTIVSSIDFDFMRGSFSFQTDFKDFDFSRVARRLASVDDKQISRRVSRLEEFTSSLPLRVPSGSVPSGESAYSGPWRVALNEMDQKWYLLDGSDATPSAPNVITLGSSTITVGKQPVVPSAGGYVYLDVSCEDRYKVNVLSGALPSSTSSHLYIPLVYWHSASPEASPTPVQCQYGNIIFSGRLF